MSTRMINLGPLSPALEVRATSAPAALTAFDNLALRPHIGSVARETRQAMADRVFDKLQRFFADGSLISAAP